MLIPDLRSDTVTRPTPAMLEAMFAAPVGDDVFGEDPSVNALEEKTAHLFNLEAGLFCPSGTMTNQIAIKAHTEPLSEVICDYTSHIYQYEGGGIAANSGASVYLLHGERGKITPAMVRSGIRPNNIHYPLSKLVSLENTSNKGGGSYYTLPEIAAIAAVCQENNLAFHLDGARVFNALVAANEQPQFYGQYFDSISVCLSKGLGTPVGSVLVGSKEFIQKARRIRKVFGGGMRQAGYLAAAGIYALDNHVSRLVEDHVKAKILAETLQNCFFVQSIQPVDTNIVIFRLIDQITEKQFLQKLAEQNVLALDFGPQSIRLVTHLDFTDDMLDHTLHVLLNLKF
ncbi:threonine aldolase [Adhaeribacter arboris]|uniref:Threonine aldolase n=1 Tax=Adhaeribacter arboris TaxID=2072846 RepID=A0A2T2YBT2_9BACT|nr:GntG family PLP-dependent aldolase [Adhaeribacter arboris]PSR52898.1 threonine aldolase [Adhaeribacter arboris]